MKAMKKITTLMLIICLLVTCFSMSAFAADGKIMFTDPTVKAGETVEVTGVVQKDRGNFGQIEITMKYDTEFLKFVSGDGVTETEAGKLTYVGDATHETGPRKEFKFSFTALKSGSTKIEIIDSVIKNVSGAVLDYARGASTITIQEGENVTPPITTEPPVSVPEDTGVTVDVNGATYKIVNEFPKDAIPKGYEAAKLEFDFAEYNAVYSSDFGLYLMYLIDEQNAGDFFMYIEEDATFVPYEDIAISDSVTIVLLPDASDVILPKEYKETKVILNNNEFPAWQTEGADGFCVLYALNNHGEKTLYQLDNTEGTYQRFVAPEEDNRTSEYTWLKGVSSFVEEHLDYVILGTGLAFLVFLLIIIVLGVKLYNRNAELDEIYDEYGIDMEDEKDDKETEDDVILDLDEDVEETEEVEDSDELDELDEKEAELFVQEGLKELFSEEEKNDDDDEVVITVEEVEEKPTTNTIEIPIEQVVETMNQNEDTLGQALAKQKESEPNEYFDNDEEDFFENFSMDFIDLDE